MKVVDGFRVKDKDAPDDASGKRRDAAQNKARTSAPTKAGVVTSKDVKGSDDDGSGSAR